MAEGGSQKKKSYTQTLSQLKSENRKIGVKNIKYTILINIKNIYNFKQ